MKTLHRTRQRNSAIALAAATALVLAACSGDENNQQPSVDDLESAGPVTITVGDLPSTQSAAARGVFLDAVEQFQLDNPNITVETSETRWDNQNFAALVAGGQMPTVMGIPFTNTLQVIENQQVAEITGIASELGLVDNLNPELLGHASDDQGNLYGVPTSVSALSLVYNRATFEAAGLDPDDPPSTWEEVVSASRTISANTDSAGYAMFTDGGSGGWIYTAMLYSLGGTVQNDEGTEVTLADGPEAVEALELLRTMYLEDQSMGSTLIRTVDDVLQAFAADQVAMFITPVHAYEWISNTFDMDLSVIGGGGVPQKDGQPHGSLLGGTVQMFSASASPEEVAAAVKWVDFYYLQKFTDEERAVSEVEAKVADGGVAGLPELSPLSDDVLAQYREWIEPVTNVNLDHFTEYQESLSGIPFLTEPTSKAQECYGELGILVQAALTNPDADLEQLVADAAQNIERLLAAG